MKKPAIVSLSSAQRQEVVNTLDEILKENNYRYKDLVLETLDFVKGKRSGNPPLLFNSF